jgi:hypothetical protein
MTGGVRFNDDHLTGTSVPTNGNYLFGGKQYPAFPGEYAVAEARYPSVMPYFGTRYGHHPQNGFGLIADLGVAYGFPEVSYALSKTLTQRVGPNSESANCERGAQRTEVQGIALPLVSGGSNRCVVSLLAQ